MSEAINYRQFGKARSIITFFTFRQVIKGALILGLAVGSLTALQAIGYDKGYPTEKERALFAQTLESNPTFQLLYGETDHLETPAGYMVYRVTPFVALIGALWGLFVATRLLRGQEEDGRAELLLTGQASMRQATLQTCIGIGVAWIVTYLVAFGIIATIGALPDIDVSIGASALFTFSLTSCALLFAAIGTLTSQLAVSRRRAILYGVVPMIIFFVLRSIGNTLEDWSWLKAITPFGWVDNIRPIYDPQVIWVIPLIVGICISATLAVWLAGRRDVGASIIPEPDTAKPRFLFMKGPLSLYVRLTKGVFLGWTLGVCALTFLMASIAKIANEAVAGSQDLSEVIGRIAGGDTHTSMTAAFLGMGGLLVATILIAMVAGTIGQLRNDEAKGLLDNFLVRKMSRTKFLIHRAAFIGVMVTLIYTIANTITLLVAQAQGIRVTAQEIMIDNLNGLGPVFLVLGLGLALFAILPRLASAVLYALLAWSFIVQMVSSLISNDTARDILNSTSLLQPIALVPVNSPDWMHFWLLIISSVVLGALGVWGFSRRDIILE